jgi:lactate dehydrogenase-like 2-hydroxyacid dehydrogenase
LKKLLVTRKLPDAVEQRARRDYDALLNDADMPYTAAEIVRLAEGADAILCCPADKIGAELIGALPSSVKVIGTFSVGFDHIAVDAARQRGIAVCNTPDVLSRATAECAMMLALAAARRAGEGERLLRAGGWTGWAPTQLLGTQISGRRLGIFGMGRIGRELARMAAGFGMSVHYHNRSRLDPSEEAGAIFVPDEATFLRQCDVLSLNAPGGAATAGWLNSARLARLPQGAIVVNTSRGSLVNDADLIAALKSGRLAAAGLDVYNGEPALDPEYMKLENVVLLPHLGSATLETRVAMGFLALDGIDAILAGETPANLV